MATILKVAVIYAVLLLVLRVVGRRSVTHMTPFEMIIIFLVGGMAIQAIVADDRSLTNALLAILSVAGLHLLVAGLKQWSPRFGALADGTPVVIFSDGQWHRDLMRRLMVQEQDVWAAARGKGLVDIAQVRYAIVERSGDISIIPRESGGRGGA